MTSQLKNEIIQYCQELNERCQLQYEEFTFQNLSSREWYIHILETLFPHLEQNFKHIQEIKEESEAIIQIISLINKLDQFQRLTINSQKIIKGDINEIGKLVQAIVKLFQIAMEQYQEQIHQNQATPKQDGFSKKQNVKYNENTHKSLSDYSKSKSVQAIVNEFDRSEEQQINSEEQKLIPPKNKYMDFTEEDKKQNKKLSQKFQDNSKNSNKNYHQNVISKAKKTNKQLKNKNPESIKVFVSRSKKKLVTHPRSPQTLKKAKSSDAIALTNKIQEDIKKTKKKQRDRIDQLRVTSPKQQELKRKEKEYDYLSKQRGKEKVQHGILKQKKKDFSQKNEKQLQRILNWRKQKVKRERQEYEESLKMKLLNKKENYVRKINKLILELEREKMIEQKKQFKQNLTKENEEAVKKLMAVEQEFKNRMNIMKQNGKAKRQERMMIKTGHKEIINQIERYLKKENEEKLLKLTDQYRNQHNNIETDFEELERKIIRVYQKN